MSFIRTSVKNRTFELHKVWAFLLMVFSLIAIVTACTEKEPGPDQKEEFYKLFGGAYNNQGIDLLEVDNQLYILGNKLNKNGQSSVLIIKTDDYGNTIWEKEYESDTNTVVSQLIISEDKQRFIAIGSQTTDNDSLYNDIKIMIFDTNGDSVKFKTYYNQGNEIGVGLAEISGGGYIIAGNYSANASTTLTKRMIRVTNGNLEVTSSFIGNWSNAEEVIKMIPISNNQYAVVGMSKNHSNPEYSSGAPFLSVFNNIGTEQVNFHFNLKGHFTDINENVGKLYVTGVAYTGTNGNQDLMIAEITSQTDQFIWQKQLGTSNNDQGQSINATYDQNLVICGNTFDNLGKSNIVIYKTDNAGSLISEASIGGSDNEFGVKSLQLDQNIISLGTSQYEESGMLLLVKQGFKK